MQFKAVLINAEHSEYGVITTPFPIPSFLYDEVIERLSALEIGDTLKRDCRVDEISDDWPILKRLEKVAINIDEMDYLAKRLDSFDVGEAAQFQAMAVKLGSLDMKDLINLTVTTSSKDIDGLTVEWLLDNNLGLQNWDTFIDGVLRNDGGSIRIKHAGTYSFVARVTDATGRVFLYEDGAKCVVQPVLNLSFELPAMVHNDTTVELRTFCNNNVLPIKWTLTRNGSAVAVSDYISGELNAYGGSIRFIKDGEYVLTAAATDVLGRSFTASAGTRVLPVISVAVTAPKQVHIGTAFEVTTNIASLGAGDAVWTLTKDGKKVPIDGSLGNNGGTVTIGDVGTYVLTAFVTDAAGRKYSESISVVIENAAPNMPSLNINPTRTVSGGKFLVNIGATATDPDGDEVTYEYSGTSADGYYAAGQHTVKVRAVDKYGAASDWVSKTFTVTNSTPTVSLTVTPTRTVKNGKFLVNISASACDADGDKTTIEYDGFSADGYYSVGTHTIRIRAKDECGTYSDWFSKTFTIANSAPTTPVITRTPNGNCVNPGTAVNITASSTDPDGDAVTYVWENRPSASYVYGLGRQVVRVKAVDSTGAESPWAAIIFFVASNTNGGGMTLTGPESTIMENGISGATITSFTFTVPPVQGHNGSDFGRVRGYKLYAKWSITDSKCQLAGTRHRSSIRDLRNMLFCAAVLLRLNYALKVVILPLKPHLRRMSS